LDTYTAEQQALLSLLQDSLWVPNAPQAPLATIDASTPQDASAAPACRYDTLSLLKDVQNGQLVWILADANEFRHMAENIKATLRALMQSVTVPTKEIVPALLTNTNESLTDAQAAEELLDQCVALKPTHIITHVNALSGDNVILLPSPVELQCSEEAQQIARNHLKNAGLLLT
jgi:hypothetical protein